MPYSISYSYYILIGVLIKGAEKLKKCLYMTFFCDPTTQQHGGLEVQIQDIVIEIVHTNTIVRHMNRELEGTVHYSIHMLIIV